MIDIFVLAGHLLLRRWPILLTLYLAGWLGRSLFLELAALAGASTAVGGFLLLPLAALAKLLGFIAMFLVLRDDLPGYQSILRSGEDAVDRTGPGRRRAFLDVTLASVLPFFLFYAAWQFIRDDVQEYATLALEHRTDMIWQGLTAPAGAVLELQAGPLSLGIIAAAYVGRLLLKRWSPRLPRWTSLVSVYLEAVWVYFSLFLLGGLLDLGRDWIAARQGMVWIADAREWLGSFLTPVAWIWDGVLWLVAEAGGVLLLPLAWLTLAGVVLGRALVRATPGLRFRDRRIRAISDRVSTLPEQLVRRLRDIGSDLLGRFRPLADALALMWRSGPVPMGLFVLAYTVLEAAVGWSLRGAALLIGPRDYAFWLGADQPLLLVVAAFWEPIRIALIVAAYDFCLRRLEGRRAAAAAAEVAPAEPTATGTDRV